MRSLKKPSDRTLGLLAALAGLAFVLIFMEPTRFELRAGDISVDQWCADAFYWRGIHRWTIEGTEPVRRLLFYTGPKVLIIALSVLTGLVALLPSCVLKKPRVRFPWIPTRRDALFVTLCLALIPLACNRTKAVSNIYCPYEHTRYGGHAPYVRLWDEYPAEFKATQKANPRERGRGFPAGHASGGFALMGLAFILCRRPWLGVAIGTFVGWSMGLYQQMRGAHYLSHTLVTWCVAWILVCLLAWIVRPSGWSEEKT
jgi:membrane-associated PAP2 superfamily phosphatase